VASHITVKVVTLKGR